MDKRKVILASALKLINENGIHNAPMSKIAKEANVATGSLYVYFENKQCLVDELYTSIKVEMNDYITKGLTQENTLEEKLYRCWRNLLDFYLENPMKSKFLTHYSFTSYISKELVESNFKLFDEYTDFIKEAIKINYIKNIPISIILVYVIGPIKELQYQHETNGISIDNNSIDNMYSVLLDGLRQR